MSCRSANRPVAALAASGMLLCHRSLVALASSRVQQVSAGQALERQQAEERCWIDSEEEGEEGEEQQQTQKDDQAAVEEQRQNPQETQHAGKHRWFQLDQALAETYQAEKHRCPPSGQPEEKEGNHKLARNAD